MLTYLPGYNSMGDIILHTLGTSLDLWNNNLTIVQHILFHTIQKKLYPLLKNNHLVNKDESGSGKQMKQWHFNESPFQLMNNDYGSASQCIQMYFIILGSHALSLLLPLKCNSSMTT